MSERPTTNVVALRDRASGRYLALGTRWSAEPADALLLDESEARAAVRRYACEPEAIELVAAGEVDDVEGRLAVA